MKDIETREEIMKIMRNFYEKLLADPSISYVFTEVVKVDLEHHFPILVDFWDGILFGSGAYRKNAMQPHLDMAKKTPITKEHFETWLKYLFTSIDEEFEGINAHTMKARAQNIASLMEFKVSTITPE